MKRVLIHILYPLTFALTGCFFIAVAVYAIIMPISARRQVDGYVKGFIFSRTFGLRPGKHMLLFQIFSSRMASIKEDMEREWSLIAPISKVENN